MDLSLDLEGTHVLITGGKGQIGRTVVQAFISAGAKVSSLDIAYGEEIACPTPNLQEVHADISSEQSFNTAWSSATRSFGPVQTCIALGALDMSVLPHYDTAADVPLEQFRRTLEVNVLGTFLTARTWLQALREYREGYQNSTLKNASLILIGSVSGHWGDRGNPDYGTTKAAVQYGLLRSLSQDVPRVYPGARVNAVAPGAVNTPRFAQECRENPEQYYLDAQGTVAMNRPVEMESVARMCLILASDLWSKDVCGQVLNVDSGKVGKIVWKQSECKNPYAERSRPQV